MTLNEYKDLALSTANTDTLSKKDMLINAGFGLNGEAGEVADILKKHLFQGHDLDTKHLKDELGDIIWYINLAAEALNTTIEELMTININKLQKRYTNGKFEVDKSINRENKPIDEEIKIPISLLPKIEISVKNRTILNQLLGKINAQVDKGKQKYGGTLDDNKLQVPVLFNHLIEELIDACFYSIDATGKYNETLKENEDLKKVIRQFNKKDFNENSNISQ